MERVFFSLSHFFQCERVVSLCLAQNPKRKEKNFKISPSSLTGQVGPDHVVPLLLLHPQHQRVPRDPGVVDQHVDRAPLGHGLVDEALDVFALAQVGADDDRVAARRLDLGRDLLGGPRGGGVVDDDAGAGGAEGEGDGLADAAGGARDDADGVRGSWRRRGSKKKKKKKGFILRCRG